MTAADSSRLFPEVGPAQQLPQLRHRVTATTVVLGAMASRDWRPMHHDRDFAIERNGVRDIFLNTPSQAAWLERYITDWSGPRGRIGRMRFEMKRSIFPGEEMLFSGQVTGLAPTACGYGWVDLSLDVHVGEVLASHSHARVALPMRENDNPWASGAADWQP